MYYIVKKETELFKKLDLVGTKIQKSNQAALDLAEKLGFKKIRHADFELAGGISSFYGEKKPEGFAYTYSSKEPNDFFPKKINSNKELLNKIKSLPVVGTNEINVLINFDYRKNSPSGTFLFHPGFSFKKNCILLDLSSAINYKPVKGMTEILASEYEKLKSKK